MKDEEPKYGSFSFCHSCNKRLADEFLESHKTLGHKTEVYITAPVKKKAEEFDDYHETEVIENPE